MMHYRAVEEGEPVPCGYEDADFTTVYFTDVEPSGVEYGLAAQLSAPARTVADIPDFILRAAHFSLEDYRKKHGITTSYKAL